MHRYRPIIVIENKIEMGSYTEIFLYLLVFNNNENNYVDYILIIYISFWYLLID